MTDPPDPPHPEWPERWTMDFTAIPAEVPVASRVRHLLKYARALRLRCTAVRPVLPETPTEE